MPPRCRCAAAVSPVLNMRYAVCRKPTGVWRVKDMVADILEQWEIRAAGSLLAGLLGLFAAPAAADEISVAFGYGSGEVRYVQFDDFSGSETWYMTRCQNAFSVDYYVIIREYGEAEQIQPVNSPLEADKTVCVVGHIPDNVKRYMR